MAIDRNLVQRTLAGIVFLAVMIFCICWSGTTALILFGALSILATYELTQLVGVKTGANRYQWGIVALISAGVVLVSFAFYDLQLLFLVGKLIPLFPFVGLTLLFLLPESIQNRLVSAVTFLFSLFYIVVPFFLLRLLAVDDFDGYHFFHLLFLFGLVWTNDTMAYVCGRLWGKHHMAPMISPKKTWEGFFGGIVFSVVTSYIVYWSLGLPFSDPKVILLPVIVGVFATIGDLFESAIKRWAGVKDSGNLIPGHGGILDRFDGAIFAVWPYFFIIQAYS